MSILRYDIKQLREGKHLFSFRSYLDSTLFGCGSFCIYLVRCLYITTKNDDAYKFDVVKYVMNKHQASRSTSLLIFILGIQVQLGEYKNPMKIGKVQRSYVVNI